MSPRRAAPPPRPTRRWPVIALAVLLGTALVYLWAAPADDGLPALDSGRDTVVFLGDSITSGHGLPLETAFPHRLGRRLGVPIRNAGISGDTTAGGLRRLTPDVLDHRPKIVVVELGANDAFRRVPVAETLRTLRTITRRIREAGSGVVLLHLELPSLGGEAYRDGYREIAKQEGAWLVEDFLDGVVPGLTTDGLHPTEEGHARLAGRLEPVLRQILAR